MYRASDAKADSKASTLGGQMTAENCRTIRTQSITSEETPQKVRNE